MKGAAIVELYCPPAYKDLTPGQRRDIANGCGPAGYLGFIVPDNCWGVDLTEACNIHDYMYYMGETIEDKLFADRVFLNNMLRIIEAKTEKNRRILRRLRISQAQKYYDFVDKCGGPFFWAGKNTAECTLALAV